MHGREPLLQDHRPAPFPANGDGAHVCDEGRGRLYPCAVAVALLLLDVGGVEDRRAVDLDAVDGDVLVQLLVLLQRTVDLVLLRRGGESNLNTQ